MEMYYDCLEIAEAALKRITEMPDLDISVARYLATEALRGIEQIKSNPSAYNDE